MDLEGRVALLVGGASGMGLASGELLASRGASVVIADRDGSAAMEQAERLRSRGWDAVGRQVDACSAAERAELLAFIEASFGGLNVVLNTVGSHGPAGLDHDERAYDEAFELNVKVHYFTVQQALPLLRARAGTACVFLMSSAGGMRYGGRSPLYATTKAAVIMMARALAREVGPAGVRVHALCPGPIDTPFGGSDRDPEGRAQAIAEFEREIPLRRIGNPDDVGQVVAYLASDAASYLTGLVLPVDGGILA